MTKKNDAMMQALKTKQHFSQGNVVVKHDVDNVYVMLHGHNIAQVNLPTNTMQVSWCGYATVATTNTLRPVIQHFLGAGLEPNAVKVQCLGGTPTITIGDKVFRVSESRRILIECDQLNVIEITESHHAPVTEAW